MNLPPGAPEPNPQDEPLTLQPAPPPSTNGDEPPPFGPRNDGWPQVDPDLQPALLSAPLAASGVLSELPRNLETEEQRVAREARAARRRKRLAIELLETIVLAAFIFFAVRALAQNFRVEGSSMEPGLHDGQYLLVNKAVYQRVNLNTLSKYIPFIDSGDNPQRFVFHGPHRGDVIVFKFPEDESRDFIKRVIGVPGDTVEVRADGIVFVNGSQLDEPYITEPARRTAPKTWEVPEHNYFVLGDNRGSSSDSRSWGFVPEENVIGQAMFSYWPFDDLGGVGNHKIDVGFVKIPVPF